jgi:hypothetical protein
MHDSNKVTENDRSGDDDFVIIIDDDYDDTNPLIAGMRSRGAPGSVLDAATALPMVAVATPTPPTPHAFAESLNTGGAPPTTSKVALTIPPPLGSMVVTIITRAPLTTVVSVATQIACT